MSWALLIIRGTQHWGSFLFRPALTKCSLLKSVEVGLCVFLQGPTCGATTGSLVWGQAGGCREVQLWLAVVVALG